MNFRFVLNAVLATTIFAFASCEKDIVGEFGNGNQNGNNNGNASRDKGVFVVELTDAPGDFAALEMEIASVDAYVENEGWVNLNSETQFVNILELTNGNDLTIASETSANAGMYTHVRITFGQDNSLTLHSDLTMGGLGLSGEVTMDVAFQGSHEVVIEVNEELESGDTASVLLDFNVAQSVIAEAQAYVIDPVITEIEDAETGVQGQIDAALNAAILITNGTDTASTYADAQGSFIIRGLAEGEYVMTVIEESQSFLNELVAEEHEVSGIIVTEGEITYLGMVEL